MSEQDWLSMFKHVRVSDGINPHDAILLSKCVDPKTCHDGVSPLKRFPLHVLGIHDAVKIENIGDK